MQRKHISTVYEYQSAISSHSNDSYLAPWSSCLDRGALIDVDARWYILGSRTDGAQVGRFHPGITVVPKDFLSKSAYFKLSHVKHQPYTVPFHLHTSKNLKTRHLMRLEGR